MSKNWLLIISTLIVSSVLSLNGMGKIHPAALLGPDIDEIYYHSPQPKAISETKPTVHYSGFWGKYIKSLKEKGLLSNAPTYIEEIVRQGVKDFGIQGSVKVLEKKFNKEDTGPISVLSAYESNRSEDEHLIEYCPWWFKIKVGNKGFDELVSAHPQTEKFALFHELAHAKHRDNPELATNRSAFTTYFSLAGIPFVYLASGKWGMNKEKIQWGNILKINAAHYILSSAVSYCYYRYLLAEHRKMESAADEAAYKILLKNNEIKPIVHWILDLQILLNISVEDIPTTHPSYQKRIAAAKKAIVESKILWTNKIYKEVLCELKYDRFKDNKIEYLNALHTYFIDLQGEKDKAHEERENKKSYKNAVLTGAQPANSYCRIKRWH